MTTAEALVFASETLSQPPKFAHVQRVEPIGERVATFVLPLDLVKPQNRTRFAKKWMAASVKSSLQKTVLVQLGRRRSEPLPGRPMVRCIRFSSSEPDRYNDGFKFAVDRLVELRLIADDKPALCDLHQLWEYAPPRCGFALIEVFTGAT